MNLGFEELKCPKCGKELESGMTTVSSDVQMVKRCVDQRKKLCDFWMIIVIPDNSYNYAIQKTLKS